MLSPDNKDIENLRGSYSKSPAQIIEEYDLNG